MMDTTPDNGATVSVTETLPPFSVGKILSEARISQGLSIADVAASIKFAPRQVEALEADDFGHLPELAFVRGFVRSYARLLHIDEITLLNALPPAHQKLAGLQEDLPEVPFSSSQSNRRTNVAWIGAAAALAVVVGIVLWVFDEKPATKNTGDSYAAVAPAPVEVQPVVSEVVAASPVAQASPAIVAPAVVVAPVAATPAVVAPAAVAPVIPAPAVVKPAVVAPVVKVLPPVASAVSAAVAPSGKPWAKQGPIHLVFDAEAWVDIKDNTGKTLLKQVNPQGSERWLRGEPPYSLVIGNASGVRLYYEGEEVDLSEFSYSDVARLTLVE
jgi:cytoskeleton protein RodZ